MRIGQGIARMDGFANCPLGWNFMNKSLALMTKGDVETIAIIGAQDAPALM
jgi:hypothetical protein